MKAEDIREWDNVEIQARLGELREEKFRLRFQMGTMQLENPKMVLHVRRDVARLNTILRERELSEKSTEAVVPSTEAALPPTEAAVPPTEAADAVPEAPEPPETEE
jgi:large subunit ribosomal protein L29